MPVTLAAYALDTLADVKVDMGITDDARNDQITSLINRWSQAILRETGREFAPAASSVARTVEYVIGARTIWLRPYEARTVTAVTIDPGSTNAKVLAVGDWMLEPITNPDGVYDRLQLAIGKEYYGTSGAFAKVPAAVTGTWGWAAVPEQIKGMLRRLVADEFKKDVAVYTDADGNLVGGPVTVPYAVREELADWKRPYIGAA